MLQEYERLVGEHYEFIFRYLCWLFNDRTLAEDLTQETFTRVWRGLPTRGTGAGNHRAWLITIARRIGLDHLRSERRSLPLCAAHHLTDPTPSPGEQTVARDEDDRLRRAVAALPEPYRTAVVLCKIEELHTAEVSRATGVPRGTVKWRVARGLRILRDRLAEQTAALPEEIPTDAQVALRRR